MVIIMVMAMASIMAMASVMVMVTAMETLSKRKKSKKASTQIGVYKRWLSF